jgi:6-phosphogluconolactonase (cycloisomerase 2 family)
MIQGSNSQLNWPSHIALDVEHQEIFVSNIMDNSVLVFRATDSGNAAPIRVIKGSNTEIDHPLGMSFDAKNQEIVVSNWGNQRAVVFPRLAQGNVAPLRRIRSAPDGTPSPMLSHLGSTSYDTKRDEILVQQ